MLIEGTVITTCFITIILIAIIMLTQKIKINSYRSR